MTKIVHFVSLWGFLKLSSLNLTSQCANEESKKSIENGDISFTIRSRDPYSAWFEILYSKDHYLKSSKRNLGNKVPRMLDFEFVKFS